MVLPIPEDKDNLYRILDRRLVSKTFLIKESIKLYKKNFLSLITLLALSSLLIFFVFSANQLLPTQDNTTNTHYTQYGLFTLSILTFILGHILILFNTIKLLHSKENLIHNSKHIIKKLPMISLSLAIGSMILLILISLITSLSSFLFSYYSIGSVFLAKFLLSLIIIPMILVLTEVVLRLSFFAFVIILEDKYLFQPLVNSLAYSRNYILPLIRKIIAMVIICGILAVLSYNLLFLFLGSLNTDISYSGKILLSCIGLILPIQLFIIAYYVLYQVYSKDFPEVVRLTSVQKAKLKIAIFAMAGMISILLFFLAAQYKHKVFRTHEFTIKVQD